MGTSSAWTPERRAKQSERIRRVRPWDKSTGPRTQEGKAISSQNACKPPLHPDLVELYNRLADGRMLFKGRHRSTGEKELDALFPPRPLPRNLRSRQLDPAEHSDNRPLYTDIMVQPVALVDDIEAFRNVIMGMIEEEAANGIDPADLLDQIFGPDGWPDCIDPDSLSK